jgi:hypothetical protein
MYIVTRKDLSVGMQFAQTAHAAMEWLKDYAVDDDTVIVLTVDTQTQLHELLLDIISEHGSDEVSWFREPDLDGALTAIAMPSYVKHSLRKLPLAGK